MTPVRIRPGPWLLRPGGTLLAEHRSRYGSTRRIPLHELVALAGEAAVLGRGGAGFPFARKLESAGSRRALRRHLVVNLSEGEPASAKDSALAQVVPHLVLDGAVTTARALGVREIQLVVAEDDPVAEQSLTLALAERRAGGEDHGLRWRVHRAAARFVAGESSAVLELVRGRENLPVTSWESAAVRGLEGRPTLVCNGETLAQVAALVHDGPAVPGTADEPGTRILSITRADAIHVVEVPHGAPWASVLTGDELARPVLLGGYHGAWLGPGRLTGATVTAHGPAPLGAGIVIPLAADVCPLARTTEILQYLADQSARRCGPCVHGLPALAESHDAATRGADPLQVQRLVDLVTGRGACAHPDGTARLATSAISEFAAEYAEHRTGRCSYREVA